MILQLIVITRGMHTRDFLGIHVSLYTLFKDVHEVLVCVYKAKCSDGATKEVGSDC